MAMNTVINTNVMALTAHRNLGTVGNRQNKANQRLSSGKKINSAADDAAGLAISEKMKAQIKGLDMASKNSEDAISLIQTAEGSLTEVNNMLTRVRELTVQAGNDTNQQQDRVKIAEEVSQLLTEIDSISARTEFNEKKLNDGSFENGYFQIGSNAGQSLNLSIGEISVESLGLDQTKDVFGVTGGKDGAYLTANVRKNTGETVNGTQKKAAAHKVESQNIDGLDAKEYTFELSYRDAKGDIKTIKSTEVKVAVDKVGENIRDAFKGIEIDGIKITGNAKKVTFEAKEAGSKGKFEILGLKAIRSDNKSEAAIGEIVGGTVVEGKDARTEYDLEKLAENGATLTIGGKTYKKVAANNVQDKDTEFSNSDEFVKLLAKGGIVAHKVAGQNTTVEFKQKGEGYRIDSNAVSNVGKDYSNAIANIDKALKTVTTQRAQLGANQNRLEYTINSLNLSSENLAAAKSRVEDTDMAKEMMNLTSANVLQQAATSILAQANQAPNNITQLLG